MPKKSALTTPVTCSMTIGVVTALAIGSVLGFVVGRSYRPLTEAYLRESGNMMQSYGANVGQASKLMMESGQMMQQQGKRWGARDMMSLGKALEESSTMMEQYGGALTGRGSSMMDMMR